MGASPPEVFTPVLERLRTDAAVHFGAPAVHFEPLGYEDREFSHLLRVAVSSDRDSEPFSHLYVKVTKRKNLGGSGNGQRDRVVRDFETTQRVHALMSASTDLGVVPPVACYPEHLAIVTEQIVGPTLLQHLSTHAAWFPTASTVGNLCETLSATGRWIRVFQSTLPPDEPIAVGVLRDYIDHRLKRVVSRDPRRLTEAGRARILHHIDYLAGQIPSSTLRQVPVHSDLAMGNILISGKRIVVLDFAMAKMGTALHDLGRLFVQLDLIAVKPHVQERVVRRLQESLLAGYDPTLTVTNPLFRLLLLLHRVNHIVTLLYQPAQLVEAAYNRLVLQRHYRWVEREIANNSAVKEPA